METQNNLTQTYNTVEPEKNNSNLIYYVIFGVVILAFLAVAGVMLINKNKLKTVAPSAVTTAREEISPQPLPKTFQGLLQLKALGSGVVEVWADSGGADVISYDVLISFDKNQAQLTKIESELADFSVLNQELDKGIVVTGFKTPASTLNHNWRSIKLLTLTFQPKAAATVEILTQLGKRTSKFVDKQTKVYYPEGNRVEIE